MAWHFSWRSLGFDKGFLGRLAHDRRGLTAITAALVAPAVLGFTGIAVEVGLWYTGKRSLQTAADAAAVGGAMQRARGDFAGVIPSALLDAQRHGYSNANATVTIHHPPTAGPRAGDTRAVEAIITQPRATMLAALFMADQVTIQVRAVAALRTTGSACVLALDPTAARGVEVSGSTIANFSNCVLAANSNSNESIYASGSSTLTAESLWTTGDYTSGGSTNTTLDRPPVVHAWPLEDPYAGLTIPALGGCNANNASYHNETKTINPGVYCNGIDFGAHAKITLNPGTYYINKGDLKVNASAEIKCNCDPATGAGVTIVLTSTGAVSDIGSVTVNGGAKMDLMAPTGAAEPYKGVLFFQDRRASTSGTAKFNGGADMVLAGAIYFPQQEVQYTGDNTTIAGVRCTQIVSRLVEFIGNSTIINTGCEAAGITPITITGARLVE